MLTSRRTLAESGEFGFQFAEPGFQVVGSLLGGLLGMLQPPRLVRARLALPGLRVDDAEVAIGLNHEPEPEFAGNTAVRVLSLAPGAVLPQQTEDQSLGEKPARYVDGDVLTDAEHGVNIQLAAQVQFLPGPLG